MPSKSKYSVGQRETYSEVTQTLTLGRDSSLLSSAASSSVVPAVAPRSPCVVPFEEPSVVVDRRLLRAGQANKSRSRMTTLHLSLKWCKMGGPE